MKVKKRNGSFEEVKLDKITRSVTKSCEGLEYVEPSKIAFKTVGAIFDGISTRQLDELSISTAVNFIIEDPNYSKVAARLLSNFLHKEVENHEVYSFSQSIQLGLEQGLISDQTFSFVMDNKRKLNGAIKRENDFLFEYYGIKTIYDRYLLKHPIDRTIIETPQYFLMRVACGLSKNAKEAVDFYNLLSSLEYMTSTPTLFNSGTTHSQMSSCYLLDSPMDDLKDLYKRYQDIAMLSKWAGGIGVSMSRIRSSGSLIRGTNGKSNGIIPWIHTLDSSVAAVNQGGKRKGSACVYLDTWHPDIMEFLELKNNTGDKEKRAHNLNIANWIPNLFMKRVSNDEHWSLFDPKDHPDLLEVFGEEFEKLYLEKENKKEYVKQIKATELYAKMMVTISETGNGWMTWSDTSNQRCNSAVNGRVVRLSNLCVSPGTFVRVKLNNEIIDVTIETLTDLFKTDQDIHILSFNEAKQEFEWDTINNVGITNTDSEVITITDDDFELECTEDHLILTERGWIMAKNLLENDKLIKNMDPVHKLEIFKLKNYQNEIKINVKKYGGING